MSEDLEQTGGAPPDARATATAIAWTMLSALAYALAFPPSALRPLAWVALVPFLAALERVRAPAAWLLGCLWAFVMTFTTSDCLPRAVENYYRQSALVGWSMLFGATLVTMVPYYSAFALAYWLLAKRFGTIRPLLAAAAWVAAELARVEVLGGNPWAVSGYSQIGFLALMQIAEITGVHGIGFLIVAVNAALLRLWQARALPMERRGAAAMLALVLALLCATLLYGRARIEHVAATDHTRPAFEVAIIQGNLDLGSGWRSDLYGKNLRDYLRLTAEAIRASRPDVVFWPESAMTFFLPDEPSYQAAIGRVLAPTGAELIAGGPRVPKRARAGGGEPRLFNSTFLLSPQGQVLAWQDKTKLLPFAEFFPLQSVDLLRRDFGRARQFSAGAPRPPLPSRAGRAGAIVCNEAMYPEPARERVASGAEYLVSPSNDSWFDDLQYSLQAYDIVRLRAVEQRRDMVRTSTAGPSAIIDAAGRVVVSSEPFVQTWIAGRIRPRTEQTFYAWHGDVFAWTCLLMAALACVLAAWRRGTGARPNFRLFGSS